MKNVCYLDLYFIWNWWMDSQILSLVDVILEQQQKKSLRRIASGIGAIIACLEIYLECLCINNQDLFLIKVLKVITLIISPLIITKIYNKEKKTAFWQVFFCILLTSFLLGGGMEILVALTESIGSIWFMFFFSYFFCWLLKCSYGQWKRKQIKIQHIEMVSLWIKGKKIELKGLIDTGNCLYTLGKKEAVHIIERSVLLKYFPDLKMNEQDIYLIPFQSVGEKEGILIGFRAEKMQIKTKEGELEVDLPIIGISPETLTIHNEYQILIHSSIERSRYVDSINSSRAG